MASLKLKKKVNINLKREFDTKDVKRFHEIR